MPWPTAAASSIETRNAQLDDAYAAQNLGVTPGPYVLIAVTDTGIGMSADVSAKAFDPFFTTKEVGKGTGLGLSQVYGFIKQSSGYVKIDSAPGRGTTVKVYLPRMCGSEDETASPSPRSLENAAADGVAILVVEDEPAMRQVSGRGALVRASATRVFEARRHDGAGAMQISIPRSRCYSPTSSCRTSTAANSPTRPAEGGRI